MRGSQGREKKAQAKGKAKAVAVTVLFLALVSLVVFESGIVSTDMFKSKPTFDKELLPSVALRGTVRMKDLALSKGEIKKINYSMLKHRETFDKVDFHLSYSDVHGGREIFDRTKLQLSVQMSIEDGGEIVSWGEEVERKDMVKRMVRCMDKAAAEYERYQQLDGAKKTFERLYI